MLNISIWQRVVIIGLCLLGGVFALPNAFYSRVELHNDAVAAIEKSGETPERAADRALWPEWMPNSLVNLGLDLRGGAHLLVEVQVEDVYKSRMDSMWPAVRDALVAQRELVGSVRRVPAPDDELKLTVSKPENMAKALEIVRGLSTPVISLT
jgi:preprotein translocase subunit SecD